MPEEKNEFLDAIQQKLLGTSGVVTSDSDEFTKSIESAIAGVEKSRETTKTGISASFERQRIGEAELGERELTGALEARRGFGTSNALISQIKESTDKALKDLDLREKQALAASDFESASAIAGLKLEKIKFQQESEQRTFTNLLAAAGVQLQAKQEKRLAGAQAFTERSAMAGIALQYGIELKEGDTLDSLITRVSPIASEEQRTQLAKLKAETLRANAEAQKIIRDGGGANVDKFTASILAQAFRRGDTSFLGGLKSNADLQTVYGEVLNQEGLEKRSLLTLAQESSSLRDFQKRAEESATEFDAKLIAEVGSSFDFSKGQASKGFLIGLRDIAEGFFDSFAGVVLQEPQSRIRLQQLDRKFIRGDKMTEAEMEEYRTLGKKAGIF